MKRVGLFFVAIYCLLLVGARCGSAGDIPEEKDVGAIPAKTAEVVDQLMPRSLPLTGALVANQQAYVAANASGVVTRAFVERGALVEEGDSIAQVDTAMANSTLTPARANPDPVRTDPRFLDRQCQSLESLRKQDLISKSEYERLRSDCGLRDEGANAAGAPAGPKGKMLPETTIKAPFAGLVEDRLINVGEYVEPPSRVVYLVQITPLKLELRVPEDRIGSVTAGGEVIFEVTAFPGETFTATIANLAPTVDPTTQNLTFEATVPNEDGRLRPGMLATASLKLADEMQPVVPRKALRLEGGNYILMMVVNGHIEARAVQIGTERDGEVAIVSGIKAGDHYVLELSEQVRDGAAVR